MSRVVAAERLTRVVRPDASMMSEASSGRCQAWVEVADPDPSSEESDGDMRPWRGTRRINGARGARRQGVCASDAGLFWCKPKRFPMMNSLTGRNAKDSKEFIGCDNQKSVDQSQEKACRDDAPDVALMRSDSIGILIKDGSGADTVSYTHLRAHET